MSSTFCGQCGAPLNGGRFCGRCGTAAERGRPSVAAVAGQEAASGGTARFPATSASDEAASTMAIAATSTSEPAPVQPETVAAEASAAPGAAPDSALATAELTDRSAAGDSAPDTDVKPTADRGAALSDANAEPPAPTATHQAAPGATAVIPPTSALLISPAPVALSLTDSRPHWLAPVAVSLVLMIGATAVAGFFMFRATDEPKSSEVTSAASPDMSRLVAADQNVVSTIESANAGSLSTDVADAAQQAANESHVAAGAIGSIHALGGAQHQTKSRLRKAVSANENWANALVRAALTPTQTNISALERAALDTSDGFAALRTAYPELTVPASSVFAISSVSQLAAQARAQAKAARPAAGSQLADYVGQIDQILSRSVEQRRSLVDVARLVTAAQPSVSFSYAIDQINGVIEQRRELLSEISVIRVQLTAARTRTLLITSLGRSLDDDQAISDMVQARYSGDTRSFDSAFQRHQSATDAATTAKQAFIVAYNQVRARVGEQPLPIDYRY